jgi:hypothetical protein
VGRQIARQAHVVLSGALWYTGVGLEGAGLRACLCSALRWLAGHGPPAHYRTSSTPPGQAFVPTPGHNTMAPPPARARNNHPMRGRAAPVAR